MDRPTAENSLGQKTNLPAQPERKNYPDDESFQEALDGWNYRVRPLLSASRTPKPATENS